MIRDGLSSPCYEGRHEKCQRTYTGYLKRYDPDKARFFYEWIDDFACPCECHQGERIVLVKERVIGEPRPPMPEGQLEADAPLPPPPGARPPMPVA